ncbi:predicted protein [Histoplasma mississippiense (nom. inval.)]|uniref:predicted protein n=1 Tax=Ajellomyces capsulatus (strain NAm1 / WU24) TaxID=2059318 RepID=UPI000157BCB0|nr:predicted protein [Histoplasma mississippiense (nom. inval.)]EDN06008.1 predicted protein [Histoplasma mississippiense (nom. inval.)]
MFDKVTYTLHPSFGNRAIQNACICGCIFTKSMLSIMIYTFSRISMSQSMFLLMLLCTCNVGGVSKTFKNPKPALLNVLREYGPVPGDENGVKSKRGGAQDEGSKKKKRIDKNVDMDKLADGLQKLGEDDLLQVVQMVHDNKSSDSYTKNDIEQGEFHVDLYTLPDSLIKMLWDFTQEKGVNHAWIIWSQGPFDI